MSGRVQGVFYRAWARDEAKALNVHGWVRNCDDGSVEAHVEGDADALEQLLVLMRDGPSHARVDDFSAEEAEPEGHHGFDVLH